MIQQRHLVILGALLAVLGTSLGYPKPIIPFKHMDPVDSCLFVCSMCFKENLLLACANKACLQDVASGRPLGKFWLAGCPLLQEVVQRK